MRVGLEATGYSRWFERLLAELGFEVWLSLTTTATALAQISHDLPVVPPTTIASTKPAVCEESNVKHYTAQRSCPDSKLYGKVNTGVYMTQEKALERGYRPAGQIPCR